MAQTPINASEIEAGDPTKQELFGKIKNNIEDLDTRTTSLESGSNVAYPSLQWLVNGTYEQSVPLVGTGFITTLDFNITVLAGRLRIVKAGTGGTTEIDFLYKRGAGAFTSIFSTLPSVGFGSGDYAVSVNGVLDSPVNLLAGDIIRMDITTTQSGDPIGLLGIIQYEKT